MKRNLFLLVMGATLLGSNISVAQGDADNFYKNNSVEIQKATFHNQYKMKVTGNLFLPKGMKKDVRYPAIIVGHPMGAVKEQGATPQTTTHPTLTSNVKFMNFYPFTDIETISPRPLLFIIGANSHSREFSEDAYRLAAEPKEFYVVPNA